MKYVTFITQTKFYNSSKKSNRDDPSSLKMMGVDRNPWLVMMQLIRRHNIILVVSKY